MAFQKRLGKKVSNNKTMSHRKRKIKFENEKQKMEKKVRKHKSMKVQNKLLNLSFSLKISEHVNLSFALKNVKLYDKNKAPKASTDVNVPRKRTF